ncbi:WhiB family transcriptional regulator [Streptomyces sp. NPDC047022]|uniref:WhiB family transcriptional regulator n=1 Tax=Streptomyces sp. NPDC047022 TaxID=3155737 RepID=UPI0033F2D514
MRTTALPHTDRPGTDELLVRYRLAARASRTTTAEDIVPVCSTDPNTFFEGQASGLTQSPNRHERSALLLCSRCPLAARCLVTDMREAPSVFQVIGVRAGLRQSERRALYLALRRAGVL